MADSDITGLPELTANPEAGDWLAIDDISDGVSTRTKKISVTNFLSKGLSVIGVDTISEKTAAAGVTVDGVLCKDNNVEVDSVKGKTVNTAVSFPNSWNVTHSIETAGLTITDIDNKSIIVCRFTADGTVVLPTLADNQNRWLRIYNDSSGGWVATVDGEGSEVINTQLTVPLVSRGDYIDLLAISGKWLVLNFDINYSTGWINRSDWTNVNPGTTTTKNTDSNANHKMGAPIQDLEINFFVSTDGTDANAFQIESHIGNGSDAGLSIHAVDNNNVVYQTGAQGMEYIATPGGGRSTLTTQDWYYRDVIKRIRIT
jgi:hypothetical protein